MIILGQNYICVYTVYIWCQFDAWIIYFWTQSVNSLIFAIMVFIFKYDSYLIHLDLWLNWLEFGNSVE